MSERIADVAIDIPGRDSYSYRVPASLAVAIGDCVEVEFTNRRLRGFVTALSDGSPPPGITLKLIQGVRVGVHLPAHLMALITWGARYYRCSLGEFLAGAVPVAVRSGAAPTPEITLTKNEAFSGTLTARQRQAWQALPGTPLSLADACRLAACDRSLFQRLERAGALAITQRTSIHEVRLAAAQESHPLTDEQQVAISAVSASLASAEHRTFLLYGITGSGKTLVYLELALAVIAQGKQVLLLLPEIALTPQLAARVRSRIPRAVVWHSGFTDGERAILWRQVAAGEHDIVVGTRSALFAPLPSPGLIIVDEEHEQSYKQESVPRYHARDLAVVYGTQLGIPVLLGSATPSLESVHNARAGRYHVLELRQRPLGGSLPTPILVDMRAEFQREKKQSHLSQRLIDAVRSCKQRNQQSIILLNRRGWSPVVSCQSCGEVLGCTHCAISLTYHKAAGEVRCHYCGSCRPLPEACPACGQMTLSTFGLGTEQLVHALVLAVPALRVLRVDADTVNERQGHAKLFHAFSEGAADCLVGTQMVAKGLDFPRVTLVGVLCADRSLAMPDFRAAERTYQLVAQVSGRAGRGAHPGTVVVQAFDIHAPPLVCALEHRPREFVDAELRLRQEYGYPPFSGLVRLLWSSESLAEVQTLAMAHGTLLNAAAQGEIILGPNPAGLAWLKGHHRWHALVKSASRGAAQAFLDRLQALGGIRSTRKVHLAIDVDPYVTA